MRTRGICRAGLVALCLAFAASVAEGGLRMSDRDWKIYVVKSTHTDIGLHNPQYVQRHGTVKRIEDAMRLVDADTRADDDPAAYRYVVEGLWFWENYPMDRGTAAAWNVISNYVRRGRIDIACGCAGNHTHVMGPEELRRAALAKRRLAEKWGVGTRTMILADNPGMSWSIVKPFAEAGMENVIFAPNQWNPFPSTLRTANRAIPAAKWNPDARGGGAYIDVSYDSERPMVFRWESFDRSTNLLVWCSTHYAHGLERVGIRPGGAKLEDVERKMPAFLALLERKCPYDIWLTCDYGDDEAANTAFADFAAEWNAKWDSPKFVTVGRLDEPFDELRRRFGDRIPTVRGEMTSGWLQHVASTPELLSAKLEAERGLAGATGRAADRAWWELVLNDEHSYGTSGYQGRRVFETWMQHRDWIERAQRQEGKGKREEGRGKREEVSDVGENRWYRVKVNGKGEIESIFDKEFGRELLDGTANRFLYTRDNHRTWADESLLGAKITRRVFLAADEKRIDVEDTFEHARDLFNTRRYYRYGYIAFPFAVPGGEFRAMLGGGEVIDPYRDQSGYATDAFVAVRDWCAVENGTFGVALRQMDTMLTEFGEIHPDKTCFTGVPPKGKTAVYSYAFTDWLQMHQPDGDSMNFRFRYSIVSYAKGREPWGTRATGETPVAPMPLAASSFPESDGDGWTGLIEAPRAGHGEADGQMYLLWGADLSPAFSHYELYRDGAFVTNVFNEAPDGIPYRVARYEDRGLGTHSNYTYRIRKVMKDGTRGELSAPFVGRTREVLGEQSDSGSVQRYDVFVAGGTLDAVRTAVRAREEGKSVFLAAPRPYCGEDRAATLDLTRHPDEDENDPLIREIFNPAYRASGAYNVLPAKGWRAIQRFEPYETVETAPVTGALDTVTTPLLVKRACDRALLAAKVEYLTAAPVVSARREASGDWLVTYVSRSGETTVRAREFVDRRMSRRVTKGRHRFTLRTVRGPKPRVETRTFEYDVPSDGALGMVAAENHARSLVDPTNLLDVAEWAVCEDAAGTEPCAETLPVLATCDVVVAGGGTGGGPAAVAAARSGAKTILVEYQNVLGGVTSEGRIGGYGSYYDGNVCGYTKELERTEGAFGRDAKCAYFFARSESLRREIARNGGEAWLGTMVAGAQTDGNRLTGVIVVLPDGTRGVIRCKVAVDATGNSDLAAAAGAATEFISADELSLQGCGMAGQPLGSTCVNSDIGFVDETDAADLCFFALRSRLSLPDRIWNQSSLVDSRERRRILGDFRISPVDLFLNRRYPDVVCTARSSFDTHGQTAHPIFFIRDTGKHGSFVTANIPYRALLPRGVEGLLVTGLGISAHRDAMPVLRMKADIQNQGYAAGLAAAMAAADGVPPRRLDVRRLQGRLVEIGNLAPEVMGWRDTLPLSDEALAAAVRRIPNGYDGLPEAMSDPARAIPLLREVPGFECIHVRALLGDPTAAEGMVEKLKDLAWDEGWNYKGMSQYLRSVGTVDRYVIALGNTKSKAALPVLDRLASELTGASEYSHFRALALAYESIGDGRGAAALARLLTIPGVGGHVLAPDAIPPIPGYDDRATNAERSDCLRELCVARALYRLGDVDGLGRKTLESYVRDPRRAYANHARKVLSRPSATVRIPLRDGWRFTRIGASGERDFTYERMSAWLDGRNAPPRIPGRLHRYVQPGFDDSGWREVSVPHDWGIENAPDVMQNGIREGNFDMTGYSWYRKRFRVSGSELRVDGREVPVPEGGKVHFACDGAASFAMVWINGHFVGGWPYQYTSWRVDLTPYLVKDGENELAIRTEQYPEINRWYGGAGLYRECALEIRPANHIVPESVFITTPEVTKERALVKVTYEMSGEGRKEKSFEVKNPRLWDVDDPHLYTLDLEGERFRYGIRSIGFFPDKRGFQLNGRRVQLRGVCLHQDLGALGCVWNRAAWRRRLLQLREAGVNAIRMSHYRHAAGLYDLCDELGFLVLDEVFDAWERGFCENDYHRLFPVWAEKDLRSWVRTTRNHPSVVMRTIGNEISEQRGDFGETDMPRFEELGRKLIGWVREEDSTRPVSAANNGGDTWKAPEAQWVDVYGFNYKSSQFADYRALHPEKPMFSTEMGCHITSRGEYYIGAGRAELFDFRMSSYGNTCIGAMDAEWAGWEAEPSVMGGFYWSGFDYLGGSGHVPRFRTRVSSATEAGAAKQRADLARYGVIRGSNHTCETGLFDTAGFPKDTFWLFRAKWRDDLNVIHVLPHWNWPDRIGQKVPVEVFSNGDEVELFVNGESQGRKRREKGMSRFTWNDVVYAPGALKAVAYRGGSVWAEETVETTGEAVRLVAEAVTPEIPSDGSEYGFVAVRALDAKGRVVPRSRIPARITVTGAGSFHAADNGDGADMTGFRWPERDVFNGYLSVIVAPKRGATGRIDVRVEAEGLEPAACCIRTGSDANGRSARD